jgi:hypothetical protein
VQPRPEALVQGAQTTIFFVLAALVAVVVLYISDFREPKKDDEDSKDSDKKGPEHDPDPGVKRTIEKRTQALLAALPVIAFLYVVFFTDLGLGSVVVLTILAIALWFACFWIGRTENKNFWALAAAVFVAMIVFSGAMTYAIVQQQKYVQAVAILRGEDDTGLTGYYVAATEKNVYFANSIGVEGAVKPEGKPLQEVALNEEVTYSIGPLESQADATKRAPAMLRRLVADREGKVGTKPAADEASLPSWVESKIAATFGTSVEAHAETPESLCLMRFFEAKTGRAKGPWWMSCKEAEAQASIADVRARFALPGRFQKDYDRRVRVEVPAGTELKYVEGDTAPQCGGEGQQPCGHRYPGGGIQYWIAEPEKLGEVVMECTSVPPDQDSAWHSCEK